MSDVHNYVGIAEQAAKLIGCEGIYQDGTCLQVLPEPNDYDLCERCHTVWLLIAFEDEATQWWNELLEADKEASS